MNLPKLSPAILCTLSLLGLAATSGAVAPVLTDDFDSYPNGGTGWASGWAEGAATATLSTASEVDGGGQYLSVNTTANSSTTGILRDLGGVATLPYSLSFDYRLDSPISTFASYNDRIQIGTSSNAEYGSGPNWRWLIGVIGGDNGGTPYSDGEWYFFDNVSSSTDGSFSLSNMALTGVFLTTGVTYSFVVDVDPANQLYSASISGSDSSFFSMSDMNFRNQLGAGTAGTNLIFGAANSTGSAEPFTYSLDSISIVPEPSSAVLLAMGGLLWSFRRRAG